MATENLEELLQTIDNPVSYFRNNDLRESVYDFPDEYTNWIEEQRAVRESCILVDQSYHMVSLFIEGPDSLELISHLCVNSVQNFREGDPPQAKHVLFCNHDGHAIRDVVLFYLDTDYYVSVGSEIAQNWLEFNAKTGDYDVTVERPYTPLRGGTPREFRFEVQGPNALKVMGAITDDELPRIPFFSMDTVSINGHEIYALGHGMAEAPGLELFGPYEYHDEIEESILEVGIDHGMRQLGSMAYKTGKIGSGWIQLPVPAIYDSEEMRPYREWLPADGPEANLSIGGSFVSDDITDYYIDAVEKGHGHLIGFDHDFVGRSALEETIEQPARQRVTYVWDTEDIVDVYASLFRDGETHKFIDLPDTARRWSKTHYDTVFKDGKFVGVSKYPGYLYYEREMLSLGVIDVEHSDPGTEVTFIWGEEGTAKQKVERHAQKEINATVAPAPYLDGGRRSM